MLQTAVSPDGIATLTIDLPDRRMNVLDPRLAQALDEAARSLAARDEVRGLIITSGKPDFIAGADLAVLAPVLGPAHDPGQVMDAVRYLSDTFRMLETLGKPVVAAAPGTALGGGLELMLACHYRVGALNPRARYGLPEVGLGILPGAGGTQRLPRLIGLEAALPLLTTGVPLDEKGALATGLLDALVPAEDLLPAARRALLEGRVDCMQRWDKPGFAPPGMAAGSPQAVALHAATIAALTADPGPAYPAPGVIADCVFDGLRMPITAALALELEAFARLATGPEAPALIGLRFFARQNAARAGLGKPDPGHPLARVCRSAILAEASRLRAQGHSADAVNAAARLKGFPPPLDPETTGRNDTDDLPALARRMMLAGALAVAAERPGNADIANVVAVEAGGFPAWSGGPLAWLAAGGAPLLHEAHHHGIAIPPGLEHDRNGEISA